MECEKYNLLFHKAKGGSSQDRIYVFCTYTDGSHNYNCKEQTNIISSEKGSMSVLLLKRKTYWKKTANQIVKFWSYEDHAYMNAKQLALILMDHTTVYAIAALKIRVKNVGW